MEKHCDTFTTCQKKKEGRKKKRGGKGGRPLKKSERRKQFGLGEEICRKKRGGTERKEKVEKSGAGKAVHRPSVKRKKRCT